MSPALDPARERAAEAHAWYSTGIHYELGDDYAAAYEAYRRASELDPGNERIVLRMASTLALQRRTEDALRLVEEFVDRHPDSEDALSWLATFYAGTGDRDRVRELFRQLTRRFPDKPLGWLQLAAASARDEDNAAVIAILEEGLKQARPPTALRQELVRLHLADMRTAETPDDRHRERRRAIRQLRRIRTELPGDMETLFTLADLLVQDDQTEAALDIYGQIERLQPGEFLVRQRLARAYLAMDLPDRAIAALRELVDGPDGPPDAHYLLAELYQQAGDTEAAAEQYRAAAQADPGNPDPWLKLAALELDSDEDQALAILADGVKAVPGNPKLLEVMALIRLAQNQYTKAEALMAQVWDTVSRGANVSEPSDLFFYNYAVICTHLRQTGNAARWLRKAVDLDASLLDFYAQRALTGTPTFRTAAGRVLRALAREPSGHQAAIHSHLATIHLARERPDLAVREFDRALDAVETHPLQAEVLTPRFYFWFGAALDQDGQTDRAVEMFETCIRLDPGYADALNYLAYLWAVRAVRLDEALRHIQAALAVDPDNAAYLDTLGWIYHQMGRYDEALDFLRQADERQPNDPEILEHIEKTLEQLGR